MDDARDDPDDNVAVPFRNEAKEDDEEAVEMSFTAFTAALRRAGFNFDLR